MRQLPGVFLWKDNYGLVALFDAITLLCVPELKTKITNTPFVTMNFGAGTYRYSTCHRKKRPCTQLRLFVSPPTVRPSRYGQRRCSKNLARIDTAKSSLGNLSAFTRPTAARQSSNKLGSTLWISNYPREPGVKATSESYYKQARLASLQRGDHFELLDELCPISWRLCLVYKQRSPSACNENTMTVQTGLIFYQHFLAMLCCCFCCCFSH